MDLAAKLLLAYLLGSISGSLLLGRLRGVDIRHTGSGNAGGTNALRTQGKWFALGVIIIDIGKGVLAAGWLPGLELPGVPGSANTSIVTLGCAFAAVLGHVYPLYFGFSGGKGAATFVGATGVVFPWAVPVLLLLWLVVIVATGYVGLATVSAAVGYVVLTVFFVEGADKASHLTYATAGCLLLLYTHRDNIRRLVDGTENRFEKAMFWRQ